MVSLMDECSAILQNVLRPKLKDLGSFSIPCAVGDIAVSGTLCNLGVSVCLMPYFICKIFQAGDLKPTTISIQLMN